MVGDIYKLSGANSNISQKIGAIGIVVQELADLYFLCGQSKLVLFANGDYEEFNTHEQEYFLNKVGHSSEHEHYKFTNAMQLNKDYEHGLWYNVFIRNSTK